MSAIHRENPEATPDEIETLTLAALLRAGNRLGEPHVLRNCRDCGQPFELPLSKSAHNTKWYALCSGCLAGHL